MKKLYIFMLMLLSSGSAFSQTIVNSLEELLPYLKEDNANVKLSSGTYVIDGDDITDGIYPDFATINSRKQSILLYFEGSNSTYDFTDVTLQIKTEVFQKSEFNGSSTLYQIRLSGNNNVLKNLTMVDDGSSDDRPSVNVTNIVMDGSGNTVEGFNLTVRSSYPYGYGDMFGKGGNYTIGHTKHSAILVRGESNNFKNNIVTHRAYGHCIFMQAASNPLIEGNVIEGEMRTTDDILLEEGTGSAADAIDFMTVWGYKLVGGYMISLQEEGIRAYNSGVTVIDGVESSYGTINPTIINNTVKYFRGGVTQSHATGTVTVSGCTLIGCEGGFSVPDGGTITNCTADVSYGPAFGFAYSSDNNATIDIEVNQLHSTYNGTNSIAYIGGSGHDITIRTDETSVDESLKVVLSGDRNSIRHMEGANPTQNDLTSTNIAINNLTKFPLVVGEKSTGITGLSCGAITDEGTNNSLTSVEDCASICLYEEGVKLPVHAVSGVNYELYVGQFDEIPDFDVLESVSSDITASMDISATDSLSEFAVVFESTLEVTSEDRYSFYMTSDDLSSLWVDDIEVVSYDGASDLVESTGDICLAAGHHAIKVVRIESNSDQTFTVEYESADVTKTSELPLYGIDFSTISNLAYLGNATQSSTESSGTASLAVDGDTNGVFSDASVTNSRDESNPWWQVDLNASYHIGEIKIFNRTDACCSERLGQFMVSVLDETGQVMFGQVIEPLEASSIVIDGEGVLGRVIKVQKTEPGILSLAEVEVYQGEPQEHGGSFQMIKRSASAYAIDGGGIETEVGHSIKIYKNSNHENLTWTEIDRGDGYFSYQKYNTDLCLDGGDSETEGSDLTMETCGVEATGQHWFKISTGEGHYALQRKGSQLAIDAGAGRSDGQNVYQDVLNLMSEDQQWRFDVADLDNLDNDIEILSVKGESTKIIAYPNPVNDILKVDFNAEVYHSFGVVNINGKSILKGMIDPNDSELELDLNALPRGLYFLSLIGTESFETKKIMKGLSN